MTKIPGFVDSFWETDFNSTNGFDILCRRLKDGRSMCKSFEDFLKQRAKIEDDYSKSLIKLARSVGGSTESGTLRASWDALKQQTELVGVTHSELFTSLSDQLSKIQQFAEQQKNARKQVEEDVRKYQTNKHQQHKKTMEAKKQCEAKCKAEEDAILQFNQTKLSANTSSKELDKIQSKKEKSVSEAEKADVYYKSCLDTLENARAEWEISMENACRRFQEFEENRIKFLRNEMWVHSNLGSQACVDDDEHYENVRKVLEHCDVRQDFKSFIEEKQTGSERPAPLTYINYRAGPNKDKHSSIPAQLSTLSRRPPPPLPADAKPIPPPVGGRFDNIPEDDLYACIPDMQPAGDLHKVIKDFPGHVLGELTLHHGDIVRVTGKTGSNGHLRGYKDQEGPARAGSFPAHCINHDIPVSNI